MNNEFAIAVEALRPSLLKYAHLQLRDANAAEDVVSETILAAVSRPQAFAGGSALKTWLVGILKHKIMDTFRAKKNQVAWVDDSEDGKSSSDAIDAALFDGTGHYITAPSDWGQPEAALTQKEFFKVLEACCEALPMAQGRALMMREWMELSTQQICKELEVTETNLGALLHRARSRLNECLSQRWFAHN